MFVQSAEDLKVDPAASTLRLVKVNQQTLYFSDRPQRIAGHITMADYLKEWTAKAGKDNFGVDPPNATLSVYEPGQRDNTLVVVKITNPVVDGADLVYNYKHHRRHDARQSAARPRCSSIGSGPAAALGLASTASASAAAVSASASLTAAQVCMITRRMSMSEERRAVTVLALPRMHLHGAGAASQLNQPVKETE